MIKQTKEEQQLVEEKLKIVGLNLEKIPKIFENTNIVKYRTKKGCSDSEYKIYRFVDINDIEIYITPTTRLEDVTKKYKLAKPLLCYLEPENEENIEEYIELLNMVKELDIEKLKQIENEQKEFRKQIPYGVKYRDNFMWDIYYSEIEDKYFMMFPSKETQVETLFYLIKEKIKLQKSKKTEKIYIPINQEEYSSQILKKSEIADLENYLWYFTGRWPVTYEVKDEEGKNTIQIVGKTQVYEKIKSNYKYIFTTKEEAQKEFKLIKALFILQSNLEQNYNFNTVINEKGSLDFCFNRNLITYERLPEFINNEIIKNKQKLKQVYGQDLLEQEKLFLLEESVERQKEEYANKEKKIVTFLECKKTFFGRVSYYFKSRKTKKVKPDVQNQKKENIKKEENVELEIEEKESYTIEDLLKICNILDEKEKQYKNRQMDIKALELKKENLERKIKNATLYINEIENHKKSIFEFWKFTNRDEVSLLQEGEKVEKEHNKNKIKKTFSYEEDIEDFSKKIDEKQRNVLLPKEMDSIFAISKDIETFNILSKEKILKKDEKQIENKLKEIKKQYEADFEKIKEKDFDIFGNVVEDKTKIKILNNKKHREIEKDVYNILNIHVDTTIEEYKEIIKHYLILLKDAYKKVGAPTDFSIYKISYKEEKQNQYEIFDMNENEVLNNIDLSQDEIILNKINIKEKMPIIFYTNIMYYDNNNQTLPLGMDVSTKALIDLKLYNTKLVSRKDFNVNFLENEYTNKVKTIKLYEYDIEERK